MPTNPSFPQNIINVKVALYVCYIFTFQPLTDLHEIRFIDSWSSEEGHRLSFIPGNAQNPRDRVIQIPHKQTRGKPASSK